MGKYNFDEVIDRHGTDCLKYDFGMKRKGRDDLLPLWVADMDFRLPDEILDEFHKRIDHGIFGYTDPLDEYFAAMNHWFSTRYGYTIEPEWVTLGAGIVYALGTSVRAFTEEGDAMMVMQPVYYPFSEVIKNDGRRLVNCQLRYENNHYSIDFEKMEKMIREEGVKALIFCNPHNPVGRVWTKEELARVGEICKKNNVLVIADEIHSDLVYAGYVHTPFALASDAPHLLCTSLGKTFNVAGLRLANIFSSSAELKKQYDQEIDAYSYSASNTFGLEMVQAAYSPEGEAWLEELLVYLQGNVEVVSEWCQKHNVGFTAPQGTFLCWLDLGSAGLTDEEIIKKIIMGKEVICVPGPWFGKGGEGHLRLNIGCTRKTLVEALDRIASVLNN